jgi:hypothetical protein
MDFDLFGRKKKGLPPTGILAHAAKASGCASVHHLLKKGKEAVAAAQRSTQKVRSTPVKVCGVQDWHDPLSHYNSLLHGTIVHYV